MESVCHRYTDRRAYHVYFHSGCRSVRIAGHDDRFCGNFYRSRCYHGPNHTLPTGGMARVRGGLSVNDFIKLITVQEYDAQALRTLGPKAALLADAEGLTGHSAAIRARIQSGRPRG